MSSAPRPPPVLLALVALPVALLLVSARPVGLDTTGRFIGSATDALHHAWGLWWFAHGEGEGEITRLVSFPTGERGALLSPLVAIASLPAQALLGPAFAYNLACLCVLAGACAGVGLLAGTLARDARTGALAALALLVGRPLYAQLGVGVLEGLAIGLAAGALAALLLWVERRPGAAVSLGLGALLAVAVFENPYALVLLAPAAALGALIRLLRERRAAAGGVLGALVGGFALVLLRFGLTGGDLGGNETTAVRFVWAGAVQLALEGEGSLSAAQLLSPLPFPDFDAPAAVIRDQGGDVYLGLSVLALAGLGALLGGGAGRAALLVAGLCALLAAGSLPGGQGAPPGPFFFVNLFIDVFLPPLTQPFRFLSFAQAALAVGAALGVSALARRVVDGWRVTLGAAALLAADALWVGGPSLALPVTDLRPSACMADLREVDAGAVHLVPPARLTREEANTAAVRLQLLHGLPGTHRGIGGWRPEPTDPRMVNALAEIGLALRRGPTQKLPQAWRTARQRGLGWLVVDATEAPRWLGAPARSCGGWSAFRVPD